MIPLAYRRVMELADAHCRILRSAELQMDQDEDLEAAAERIRKHGHFQHTMGAKRTLYLNGEQEPWVIDLKKPADPDETLVIEHGHAAITYREFLDARITPDSFIPVFTSGRLLEELLQCELNKVGYQMGDQDGKEPVL